MSAPPYMKLYWGDYSRKTRHLTRSQHGAYFLLLGALWDAGGRLCADDANLASHSLCTPKEWAAMRPTIIAFFKVKRGWLSQDRVTEELAKYRDKIGKLKTAGKKGSEARRGKDSGNSAANAKQKPTYSESESSIEPTRGSISTRRERPEARADGASGLRVIEGGKGDDLAPWLADLSQASRDFEHFEKFDPEFASEVAEFIDVASAAIRRLKGKAA